MNLMVGTSTGLPPLPFQPSYDIQRDYGEYATLASAALASTALASQHVARNTA